MTQEKQSYRGLLNSKLAEFGLEDNYGRKRGHFIRVPTRVLGLKVGRNIAEIVCEAEIPQEQRDIPGATYGRLQINVIDSNYYHLMLEIAKDIESELEQEVKVKFVIPISKKDLKFYTECYEKKYDNLSTEIK